jgi:hypothetical protein
LHVFESTFPNQKSNQDLPLLVPSARRPFLPERAHFGLHIP